MIEALEGLDLALEAFGELGVARAHKFDCDASVRYEVVRFVDVRHAASTKESLEAVATINYVTEVRHVTRSSSGSRLYARRAFCPHAPRTSGRTALHSRAASALNEGVRDLR